LDALCLLTFGVQFVVAFPDQHTFVPAVGRFTRGGPFKIDVRPLSQSWSLSALKRDLTDV
jgi:hypothetical protein